MSANLSRATAFARTYHRHLTFIKLDGKMVLEEVGEEIRERKTILRFSI